MDVAYGVEAVHVQVDLGDVGAYSERAEDEAGYVEAVEDGEKGLALEARGLVAAVEGEAEQAHAGVEEDLAAQVAVVGALEGFGVFGDEEQACEVEEEAR